MSDTSELLLASSLTWWFPGVGRYADETAVAVGRVENAFVVLKCKSRQTISQIPWFCGIFHFVLRSHDNLLRSLSIDSARVVRSADSESTDLPEPRRMLNGRSLATKPSFEQEIDTTTPPSCWILEPASDRKHRVALFTAEL